MRKQGVRRGWRRRRAGSGGLSEMRGLQGQRSWRGRGARGRRVSSRTPKRRRDHTFIHSRPLARGLTPRLPQSCSPSWGALWDRLLALGLEELALGQRGDSSSHGFPPQTHPCGHPGASWSFRTLSLCQGWKEFLKNSRNGHLLRGRFGFCLSLCASGPS